MLIFDSKNQKFIPSIGNHFPSIERYNYFLLLDFNRDGIKDFLGLTFNQGNETAGQKVHLFRGAKDKDGFLVFRSFSKSRAYGPYPTSSVAVLDYNLDGQLDLFFSNWYQYQGSSKAAIDRLMRGDGFLFRDDSARLEGEGIYDRENEVFTNARASRGVSICDVDRNGRTDLIVSTSNGQQ